MNDVNNYDNSTAVKQDAQNDDFLELGTALVKAFLKKGMTEQELRAFVCKEKEMEEEAIAFELKIPFTAVGGLLYATYQDFHLCFKSVNTSEKEFLVTLPTTLVKWMDEEIEFRGYESRDELIRWVLHHHYNELRYGIKIECNDDM